MKSLWSYESFYGARAFSEENRLFDKRDIKQIIKDCFISFGERSIIERSKGIILRGEKNASIFFNSNTMSDAWRKLIRK